MKFCILIYKIEITFILNLQCKNKIYLIMRYEGVIAFFLFGLKSVFYELISNKVMEL